MRSLAWKIARHQLERDHGSRDIHGRSRAAAGFQIRLSRILAQLRAARQPLRADVSGEGAAAAIIEEKLSAAQIALASAAGVTLDALSDSETAAPGEGFAVTVTRRWTRLAVLLWLASIALKLPLLTLSAFPSRRTVATPLAIPWTMAFGT